MPIRCGNHGRDLVYHDDIPAVKACSQGKATMGRPAPSGSLDDNPPLIDRKIVEGMWYLGNDKRIIKVQRAVHGSGRLYTKELVKEEFATLDGTAVEWSFELLKGGIRMLLQDRYARKMTLEEAAEFGKLYGICCVCGAVLTNELSIELGIGPVCRGKFS